MANSSVLARLPVRGTVVDSVGPADAFKIPLLNADGKLNVSLLDNGSPIYNVLGISYGTISFDTPAVTPNAPTTGVKLFLDANQIFQTVDSAGLISPLGGGGVGGGTNANWAATSGASFILNKPLLGTAAYTNSTAYATAAQGILANTASQPGHTHVASDITDLSVALASKAPLDNPNFTGVVTGVTKTMVGLGAVDNTSDVDKPISTAQQTALNFKSDIGHTHTVSEITDFTSVLSNALITSTYSTAIPDATYSVAVGGATAQPASTWKTKTLVQALDTILFPTILASVASAKSLSLAWHTNSTLKTSPVEVGVVHALAFSYTFNQGQITNGTGLSGPVLVGTVVGNTTVSGVGLTGSQIFTIGQLFSNVAIVSGTNTWTVSVNYDVGTGTYYDNKGVVGTNLDSSRVAGSISSQISVQGLYPYYVLKSPVVFTDAQFKSAIAAGVATAIHANAQLTKYVASASGTLSVPYNMSGQYLGVAYAASNTQKTLYFVTTLDSGAITAVFSPKTTLTTSGAGGLWVNQSYNYHISSGPLTNSAATIELRV